MARGVIVTQEGHRSYLVLPSCELRAVRHLQPSPRTRVAEVLDMHLLDERLGVTIGAVVSHHHLEGRGVEALFESCLEGDAQ